MLCNPQRWLSVALFHRQDETGLQFESVRELLDAMREIRKSMQILKSKGLDRERNLAIRVADLECGLRVIHRRIFERRGSSDSKLVAAIRADLEAMMNRLEVKSIAREASWEDFLAKAESASKLASSPPAQ